MTGCFLRPTRGLLDVFEKRFFVLPLVDTDFSRLFTHTYSLYMALGRWHYMFSSPFRDAALKRGWTPITTRETIQYKRSVKAFARVTLRTRMIGWTAERFYLEQLFLVGGEVYARCLLEGMVRGPHGALGPVEAFRELGFGGVSPELPAEARAWASSLV